MNLLTLKRDLDRVAAGGAVPLTPEGRVASPCVNVCRMTPATGWCEGCRRSIDEIAAWARLDDAAREAVWRALPARGS
jgi:predicted Fe-S protein YdhL (DUF1289 family)